MQSVQNENFDYLLGMTMWSLTKEKKDELMKQRDDKMSEYNRLQAKTPISLWKDDLENLLTEMKKVSFILQCIYSLKNFLFILLLSNTGGR